MSNEPLGIVAERAANRSKYAWKRYVAPQDRVLPPEPKVEAVAAPVPAETPAKPRYTHIHIPRILRISGANGGREGGHLVSDHPAMTTKARNVVRVFCEVFGVEVDRVFAPARSRKYARPRQAAMYVMANHLKLSRPTIGCIFARDQSTVTHAVSRLVPVLLVEDLGFASRYHDGMKRLCALWAAQ